MSTHIAVFSGPLPALAHPTLSVVSTMIRRGYRVTYVTSERFASEAAALGADVLRCPRLDSPFNQDDALAMPIEHQYVRSLADLARRSYAQLLPFYQRNCPDLVVYDAVAFAGMLIADKLGTPAIRMSNQFDFTSQTLTSPVLPPKMRSDLLESERQANELLESHGSARRSIVLEGTDPTIYFYLSELQLADSKPTSDVFYAARCIAERPNVPPWKRTTPREKLSALLTSSTTYQQDFQYYKQCLIALSQQGLETFLVSGSSMLSNLGSLPANCHAVSNISLFSAMPHVDVLICGAGMATAMEALYHGVPMLMLSSGHAELEAYASTYHTHGLGTHLRQGCASPDDVAHQARRMCESSELRLSVKKKQQRLRRSPGAEEFVNWLERHLGRI